MSQSKDYQRVRNSAEEDEIEMDRLLTQGTRANGQRGTGGQARVYPNGRQQTEDRQLMYDVDEEGRRLSGDSRHSEEEDRAKLNSHVERRKTSIVLRIAKWTLISFALLILFILLGGGAYKASGKNFEDLPYVENLPSWTPSWSPDDTMDAIMDAVTPAATTSYKAATMSNGTSLFLPTTILISLDGFRADYLQRGLTQGLNTLFRDGVSPLYMMPSFPSVTFPNHFTMVTGLYPESHGIVGNSFYDPELEEEFFYTNPEHSMQPKWWTAEPLWVTAEEQGVSTAIHMWPGSEAHIPNVEPAFVDAYNGTELLGTKVERIIQLLDLPGPQEVEANPALGQSPTRPQFIAAYIPDVDQAGHHYGPNSTEITDTILNVDLFVHTLSFLMNKRNLTNIINLIVVSDHGMATTSTSRLIQLEDLIDTSLISSMEGWPSYGLRLKDPSPDHLQTVYNRLLQQTAIKDGFDVYLRDTTMPERYHFQHNDRIAPLWLIPRSGWAIVTADELNVADAQASGDTFHPMGIHGYDNEDPLMRAIFVARGPAFPHTSGGRVKAFQNTEVYNIVCDSLGIEPKPNNGTLRLPLVVDSSIHDIVAGGFTEDNVNDQIEDGAVVYNSAQHASAAATDMPAAATDIPAAATDIPAASTDIAAAATATDAAAVSIQTSPPTAPSDEDGTSSSTYDEYDDELSEAEEQEIEAEIEAIEEEMEKEEEAVIEEMLEEEMEEEMEEAMEEGMVPDSEDWKEWFGDEFEGLKDWVSGLTGHGGEGAEVA